MEIKRQGKSYTYLTLEELSSPDAELYFLVGTDMLLTIDSWKFPEKIFGMATICFVRREADTETEKHIDEKLELYRRKYGAKIIRINNDAVEISSTEIRERLLSGLSLDEYISPKVLEYIKAGGLYN
jgi:nicotinate-nucleotide adenylyltransferase